MQKAEHVAGTNEKVTRSKATPYIGAVFDLSENLSAYISYGTSFEPVFDKGQDGRFLKPTTGRNIEIGLKGEFFDQRLNVSAVIATGSVQPVDEIEVGTQVFGLVSKIYVDYNSQVKKRELLTEFYSDRKSVV